MNHNRHVLRWGAGAFSLALGFLSSGCTSSNAGAEHEAMTGAAAGAIIGSFPHDRSDRSLAAIRNERRLAEKSALQARLHAEQQREQFLKTAYRLEARELLFARQRVDAAEAQVLRLRAEEESTLRQLRWVEDYRARKISTRHEPQTEVTLGNVGVQ